MQHPTHRPSALTPLLTVEAALQQLRAFRFADVRHFNFYKHRVEISVRGGDCLRVATSDARPLINALIEKRETFLG